MQAYFVLQFSVTVQVSLYSSRRVLQGIAAGIGNPNFVRASFGFSIAYFCFSLRFDASDFSFQISGHKESGLEVVCFLVSLYPDHVYPSGSFFIPSRNLSTYLTILDLRQYSNNRRYFPPALHHWMYLQPWSRRCISVE